MTGRPLPTSADLLALTHAYIREAGRYSLEGDSRGALNAIRTAALATDLALALDDYPLTETNG